MPKGVVVPNKQEENSRWISMLLFMGWASGISRLYCGPRASKGVLIYKFYVLAKMS